MNDTFHCGDRDAIVAYLYDECDPAARAAIAAHVSHCPSCAEEIASLRATRTQLAAWTPPAASLGFQITGADERREPLAFTARARQPGPWWREPLPAWAQAAAAALIFAAGLTAGTLGNSSGRDIVATPPAASPVATAAPAPVVARVPPPAASGPAVSAADLSRLEQRLRAIESGLAVNASARTVSAASAAPRADEQVTLARVNALMEERLALREDRLRNDIAALAKVASSIDAEYRRLGQQVRQTRGYTAEELQQNREMRDSLRVPVSFPLR
jgi:hypothetical protein